MAGILLNPSSLAAIQVARATLQKQGEVEEAVSATEAAESGERQACGADAPERARALEREAAQTGFIQGERLKEVQGRVREILTDASLSESEKTERLDDLRKSLVAPLLVETVIQTLSVIPGLGLAGGVAAFAAATPAVKKMVEQIAKQIPPEKIAASEKVISDQFQSIVEVERQDHLATRAAAAPALAPTPNRSPKEGAPVDRQEAGDSKGRGRQNNPEEAKIRELASSNSPEQNQELRKKAENLQERTRKNVKAVEATCPAGEGRALEEAAVEAEGVAREAAALTQSPCEKIEEKTAQLAEARKAFRELSEATLAAAESCATVVPEEKRPEVARRMHERAQGRLLQRAEAQGQDKLSERDCRACAVSAYEEVLSEETGSVVKLSEQQQTEIGRQYYALGQQAEVLKVAILELYAAIYENLSLFLLVLNVVLEEQKKADEAHREQEKRWAEDASLERSRQIQSDEKNRAFRSSDLKASAIRSQERTRLERGPGRESLVERSIARNDGHRKEVAENQLLRDLGLTPHSSNVAADLGLAPKGRKPEPSDLA